MIYDIIYSLLVLIEKQVFIISLIANKLKSRANLSINDKYFKLKAAVSMYLMYLTYLCVKDK